MSSNDQTGSGQMSQGDAARIQSDQTTGGSELGCGPFAARAQSAGDKNANTSSGAAGTGTGAQGQGQGQGQQGGGK